MDSSQDGRELRRHGSFGSFHSNLAMFRYTGELSDLTLIAEGQRMRVHRVVMAAASPYFRAMFSWDQVGMREYRHEVELTSVSYSVLCIVVDFIYTGKAEALSTTNAIEATVAADLLLIEDFKQHCVDYVSENMISLRYVIPTLELAERFGVETLINQAGEFIMNGMDELLDSNDFLESDVEAVTGFLRSDVVVFAPEDKAFEGLMRWIDHRVNERLPYLEDLLPLVRLTLVSKSFLVERILDHEFVRENENAKELVLETMKYHPQTWNGDQSEARLRLERCRLGAELKLNSRTGPSASCMIIVGQHMPVYGYSKVICYVPSDNRWYHLPDLPVRCENKLSSVCFKGSFYVVGGDLNNRFFRLILDQISPEWVELGRLNMTHAKGSLLLAHKNVIYVVGGSSSKRKPRSRQRPAVEKYDEANDRWITCEPLPHPCFSSEVVHSSANCILLRTHEYVSEVEATRTHYLFGPNMNNLKEEKNEKLVQDLERASGPLPEKMEIKLTRPTQVFYAGKLLSPAPPHLCHHCSTVSPAMIVRGALRLLP